MGGVPPAFVLRSPAASTEIGPSNCTSEHNQDLKSFRLQETGHDAVNPCIPPTPVGFTKKT